MKSTEKFLAFEGYIKLALKGQLSYSSWLKYVNAGTSNTVSLDLNNAVSERGKALVTSLSFDNKSNQLYPNFISEKIHEDDLDLLPVTGILKYNPDSLEFNVGTADKLNGKSYKGNYLSYNDNTSNIKFGGKFNMLRPDASVKAYVSGNGKASLIEDFYTFDYLLGFAFKGNITPLVVMGTNLSTLSIPSAQDTSSFSFDAMTKENKNDDILFQKLAEFIENSGVEGYKAKRAAGQKSISALSSDFQKAIVFSNVKMNWSPEYKAFYSIGPVELSNILKSDINKSVKGYIEVKKAIAGDIITIYLEPSYGNWYFIKYDQNRLALASSSSDVTVEIVKKSKGEMADRSKFFMVQAEAMEVNQFKNNFKEHYGVNEDDYVEPASEELFDTSDTMTTDSASVEQRRKQLELNDTDNTNDRIRNANPEQYQDDASNPDKYKLKEQDTNYEQEEEAKKKANNKSTVEEQQQKQRDQEQLKNLFK